CVCSTKLIDISTCMFRYGLEITNITCHFFEIKCLKASIEIFHVFWKEDTLNKLDILDKNTEGAGLSGEEVDLKQFLQNKLAHILREEEIEWYQRVKTKELLQRDSNTKYFHFNGAYDIAKEEDQVAGLVPYLVEDDLSI
ncbi:hypothetical protein ACJX0J_039957, partial [Zea mays]